MSYFVLFILHAGRIVYSREGNVLSSRGENFIPVRRIVSFRKGNAFCCHRAKIMV